jgi:hypothetical protein
MDRGQSLRKPSLGRALRTLPVALLLLTGVSALASANAVTFDIPAPPSHWGAPYGNVPGDPMFIENSIRLHIHELFLGGAPFFNSCDIEPAFGGFGTLRILHYNNVNVEYDFSAVPVAPASVSFEYLDQGGRENIMVNGAGPPIETLTMAALSGSIVAPGVLLMATAVATPVGTMGVVTLFGPVSDLWVGGQEFFVDNVRMVSPGNPPGDLVCDRIVDHESLPLGTCFGTCAGNVPGDLVFTEDGIGVRVDNFELGGGPIFNVCRVDPTFGGFGDFHIMMVNNIDMVYDFAALPFAVGKVTIEFLDQGGRENLQVNGGTLYIGDLDTVVPPTPEPGIDFFLTEAATPSGLQGTITLVAQPGSFIKRVRLGGQEFFVDNICVGSRCDRLVDNESQALGTLWGSTVGNSPGDLFFVEDGIPVIGEWFTNPAGGLTFNGARIEPSLSGMGSSHVLHLNNIAVGYNIAAVPLAVAEVSFEFLDLGGFENLQVNGGPLYIGDLALAPAAIAPGVTFSVATTAVPGGVRGIVTLLGPVSKVLLGGQEFWTDNLCVNGEAASGTPTLAALPARLSLSPAQPNPFNPRTAIAFSLPSQGRVRLTVHNLRGRLVRTLLDAVQPAGTHQATWDGQDDLGSAVSSGVYFISAEFNGEVQTQKAALIR